MKFCHLLHGWMWKVLCLIKYQTEKGKYCFHLYVSLKNKTNISEYKKTITDSQI